MSCGMAGKVLQRTVRLALSPKTWHIVIAILAFPWEAGEKVLKTIRFVRMANAQDIACYCGGRVSLIGIFRCGCGYVYHGHVLLRCPICLTIPRTIRCFDCKRTVFLPER